MDNGLARLTEGELERLVVDAEYSRSGSLTICVLTLESGYKVVGTSSTVNPVFFDETVGREIAYRKAFEQLWALEAYHRMATVVAGARDEEEE